MQTELRCPCGHRQPVKPRKLRPEVRCKDCGQTLAFRQSSGESDQTRWLLVGDNDKPPRLAVPIPIGLPLTLGSSPTCWLVLEGADVDETHAEVTLRGDMHLSLRHLGSAGSTWINRASVLSGVVGEEDSLRIGSFVIGLRRQAVLLAFGGGDIPEVVVEEEEEGPTPWRGEEEAGEPFGETAAAEPSAAWPIVRMALCSLLILGAAAYLGRTVIWPSLSADMPQDTEFRCPIDGTVFRAPWSVEMPECPECGQLCFGSSWRRPKPMPGPTPSSAPAKGHPAPPTTPAVPQQGSEGGRP